MSQGMLGNLSLSAVRGPREDLEDKLAGPEGDRWLVEFKRFLRRESTWGNEMPPEDPSEKYRYQPYTGTVVSTIRLEPYRPGSLAALIESGQYANKYTAHGIAEIIRQFAEYEGEVGLTEAVDVHLVGFDRHMWHHQVLEWGVINHKKPMGIAHLLGMGIQYPGEQRNNVIVELDSARGCCTLTPHGGPGRRHLDIASFRYLWHFPNCLFGFVDK